MTVHLFESKITKLEEEPPKSKPPPAPTSNKIFGLELHYHKFKTPLQKYQQIIKIKNPGQFTNLKPGYTLLGINQKSIRGMSIQQVYTLLHKIPFGQDVILLTRCDDNNDDNDNNDDAGIGKKSSNDNNVISTRTLTDREKKLIARGGTQNSHCCVCCDACEGCECCCRIQ